VYLGTFVYVYIVIIHGVRGLAPEWYCTIAINLRFAESTAGYHMYILQQQQKKYSKICPWNSIIVILGYLILVSISSEKVLSI